MPAASVTIVREAQITVEDPGQEVMDNSNSGSSTSGTGTLDSNRDV